MIVNFDENSLLHFKNINKNNQTISIFKKSELILD